MSINVQVSPIPTVNVLVDGGGNLLNLSPQGYTLHANTHISGGIDAIDHNNLAGLQGGNSGEFYHLNSGQYSNLVTGDVVRPDETGQFYAASNPSGFITGVDLSDYVTGDVVRPDETGQFYAASNPSGFITGVDLSDYYTSPEIDSKLFNTGQWNEAYSWGDHALENYVTGDVVRPTETGAFYPASNPSGFVTGLSAEEIPYDNFKIANGAGLSGTNVQDALDELEIRKLNVKDAGTNLILFATTADSDISGYKALVCCTSRPQYDAIAVDVSTPPIGDTDTLVGQLVSRAGVLVGNADLVNVTTIGNIRKASGNRNAVFYFEIYRRDVNGDETLLTASDPTIEISSFDYRQFSEFALLPIGSAFVETDRIVIRYYGKKTVAGGSQTIYQFQFGGIDPVRTLFPVPASVTILETWRKNGDDVYYKIGNVGIGKDDPTEALDVVGNIFASGTISGSNLSGTNTGDQDLNGLVPYTGADRDVNIGNNNFSVSTNTLFVDSELGRVGIGTSSPTAKFEVIANTGDLARFTHSHSSALFLNRTASVYNGFGFRFSGNERWFIGEKSSSDNLVIRKGGTTDYVTFEYLSGNVGIATTTSPTEKLEVVGNIKASGTVTGGDMFSNGERVATVVDPVRTPLTGDGTTSTFAISGAAGLVNPSALIVAIDGILQEPNVNYSVSGGAITFTSPIPNGSKAVVISPTNVLQVSQNIPADGSVTSEKLDTDIEIAGQLTAPNQMLGEDDGVVTKSLLYEDRGVFLQRSKTTDTTKSVQALEDDDDFFIDIPDAGLWEITIIGVTSNEIACQIRATYIDWPIETQQGESRIGRLVVGSVGINKGANPLTQHFYSNQTVINGTASSGGFFWRFIHKASQESKITVRWCRRTNADAGETTVYAGSSITARKLNN
jgi:hypothetical protein